MTGRRGQHSALDEARKTMMERTVDPHAHLRAKQAALEAQHAPQLYLLCDEGEMRAIVRWRRGPAELRRQARAALQWFTEV